MGGFLQVCLRAEAAKADLLVRPASRLHYDAVTVGVRPCTKGISSTARKIGRRTVVNAIGGGLEAVVGGDEDVVASTLSIGVDRQDGQRSEPGGVESVEMGGRRGVVAGGAAG